MKNAHCRAITTVRQHVKSSSSVRVIAGTHQKEQTAAVCAEVTCQSIAACGRTRLPDARLSTTVRLTFIYYVPRPDPAPNALNPPDVECYWPMPVVPGAIDPLRV
jgi:hypothetical protein